jgi:hypothetical protein
MAYGGSRRPAGRAPSRRGGAGGGGQNPALYLGAGVAVIGALALVVVLATKGKKEPPPKVEPPPAPETPAPAVASTPKPPAEKPYPPLDPKVLADAKAIAAKVEEPARRADVLYNEAMEARKAGNDDVWQQKLAEASEILEQVQDEWNELLARIQPGNGYDEEQIANHWLGPEGRKVSKALERLAAIKKSRRL